MGSEDEAAVTTRFFKIMMSGFRKKMILPRAFCKKIEEDKCSARAILKTSKGRYEMKVRRTSDDQVYFEGGWPRFVDEHGLRLGDVVVFEHTQELKFHVSVFGSSACEKRYDLDLPINRHQAETSTRPAHRVRSSSSVTGKTFTVKMTHYMASKLPRVVVPISFVRVNNLEKKNTACLWVGGRRWEVQLWRGESRGLIRMLICGGWRQFYAANNLQVGDVCLFKLDPTSSSSRTVSFDVHITRVDEC